MSKDGFGGAGHFKPNEGDWTCSDSSCGNVNFARRIECNKCGTSKSTSITKKDGTVVKKGGHEIGKHMAEKSKGLFSADDWQCKSCGNVNWARRTTCNVCNAPKYGKLEQRTGYGGGFMERDEVVEYKEKVVDDDNDYDEYGRLKKGRRGKLPPVKSVIEVPPPVEDEEEDDEEDGDVSKYRLESDDEDDEDVDLSKYALSDSDDNSTTNTAATANKNSNGKTSKSRSRSRSRSRSYSSSSSSSSSSRSRRSGSRRRSYSRSRSRSADKGSKRRRSSSYSRSRSRSPKRRPSAASAGSHRSRH